MPRQNGLPGFQALHQHKTVKPFKKLAGCTLHHTTGWLHQFVSRSAWACSRHSCKVTGRCTTPDFFTRPLVPPRKIRIVKADHHLGFWAGWLNFILGCSEVGINGLMCVRSSIDTTAAFVVERCRTFARIPSLRSVPGLDASAALFHTPTLHSCPASTQPESIWSENPD